MPIYLDNNATTALDERVLAAMQPWLKGPFGNPSSLHRYGRLTRDAVETARAQLAQAVGVAANQITFTSGGTESNNLAIRGVLAASKKPRLLVSPTEHPCVFEPAQQLEKQGVDVVWLATDNSGLITEAALQAALTQPASLISVMRANNETGVIQDIPVLSRLAKQHGVPMHCDAVQALGKVTLNFAELGVQLMTLSSHKIYGPKGVGALVRDLSVDIQPLSLGGGQEAGLRPGTENVAGIVGFGAAAALAAQELAERQVKMEELQAFFDQELAQRPRFTVFAANSPRLNNTRQLAIPGWEGEALLMALDRKGIAVSSGSACHSGRGEPSHVLLSMGIERDLAYGAIRVSWGVANTIEDIVALFSALDELAR